MDMNERNAAIYAMSQGGMRQVDIAKRFGLAQSNVCAIIQKERAKNPDKPIVKAKAGAKPLFKKSEKKKESIALMSTYQADLKYIKIGYEKGLTVEQMASALREPVWKVEGYLTQVQG